MSGSININLGQVNKAFRPRDEKGDRSGGDTGGNISITISMDDEKKSSRKQKAVPKKERPEQKVYRCGDYSRPIPPKEERESEYIPIPGRNFDIYR